MADIKLNPANVPLKLHSLIPYAEKWGIRDDARREAMLREAPISEIDAMCAAVYPLWDSVDQFTIHHPEGEPKSLEVEAFYAFRAGFSDMYAILSTYTPKRALEIIGYPEAWPSMPFDRAKVPPELSPLIPYIEKWVIADQGVRDTFVQAATDAEIEDLLSVIRQVGDARVRDLMYEMLDTETYSQEGYVFALLMEAADGAEDRLKNS